MMLGLTRSLSRGALVALLAFVGAGFSQTHPRPRFAVVPISLNNVSNQPENPADGPALVLLEQEIGGRLGTCGYELVPPDSITRPAPDAPRGYLFDHPDVAVSAVRSADWVLVGRLNRVSPWVAELEVRVVSVPLRRPVSTRIVELKGLGMDPQLTSRLANRGAAWLVDQVLQAIARFDGDGGPARPCPA